MTDINALGRAELAAVIVETLADAGIDVVLVGGSCVCVYTNERFGSFDLDFIDMTYARKKDIAAALVEIGFAPRGAKAANPNRWSGSTRNWDLPDRVWLNPEKECGDLKVAA